MMNNLNSILLEGNLTKDPVLKSVGNDISICTFGIACNRYYKRDDETQKEVSFFEIESWGNLAERCGEYLIKGRGVRVVGRLKQDRWNTGDGDARSAIKIVAEHVEFRPSFRSSGNKKDSRSPNRNSKRASSEPEGAEAMELSMSAAEG